MNISWRYEQTEIDWDELSDMYQAAPLGDKSPADLELVFSNSKFKCFLFNKTALIGAGRALADGKDCSYICDIAIRPEYHGRGLGKKLLQYLIEESSGHSKIILYANPGMEGFYSKLGFKKMNTAMAIFQNESAMIQNGVLSET